MADGKPVLKESNEIIAVVRIRGSPDADRDVLDTLKMLRLTRANHCILAKNTESTLGMLEKARHMITWGEIDKTTLEKLVSKRGRLRGDKRLDKKEAKEISEKIMKEKSVKGVKPVFRLNPPSKGHKSAKKLYPRGALGYRGGKINELLKRMI